MTTKVTMPDKIGRYQILERVGKGGMGVLYRGHDPVLDREVAVKVMLADFSEDTEQMRPRFYREARSAAKLQHRNIVTVFEFAEENNQPHIVMEFLRGAPLSSRMEEQPPLTLDDKLDIVTQLCSGLGYAHKEGIVHRDVKPANVFVLQDGTVKLLDFGIAKLATSTLTRQGDVVGSAPYMSPEQIAGAQDLDGRSDVWSTGVLLYELLTGRKPFDGDGLTTVIAGILREQPPSVEQYVPGLPKQLLDCVSKALEKDRDRRYQTAEELGRELQLIRKTHQLNAPPPMDATRFASTNVLKALHDDRQKEAGAAVNKTLQQAVSPPPAAAGGGSKTWMIAAGIAVAMIGVAGGYVMTRPAPGPATNTIQTTPVTQPVQPPPQQPANLQPNGPSSAANPPVKPVEKLASANTNGSGTTGSPAEKLPAKKTPIPAAAAPAANVPAPAPAPSSRATVAVTMSAAYEFEVLDGNRVISASATSHELPLQANGKTLRVRAESVFLDQPVRVDGGAENRFDYTAPGLGRIVIRAARGDCKAMIGKKDLGYGPWQPIPAAAGEHQVDLVCPDGQNPLNRVTVTQGREIRANFTAK
ncbi:MAG: protein kinase [Cyanobacteria bacterium]|nr:protein kinase [Cyanobacteriota bacterium]